MVSVVEHDGVVQNEQRKGYEMRVRCSSEHKYERILDSGRVTSSFRVATRRRRAFLLGHDSQQLALLQIDRPCRLESVNNVFRLPSCPVVDALLPPPEQTATVSQTTLPSFEYSFPYPHLETF
ncbi:580_t:CDS:1, partial [Acaulospora colombiana]